MNDATPHEPASACLTPDEFDAIDAILDDLRTRSDETPQWEFCEGFMAALVCCRRAIAIEEYLPVLLDMGAAPEAGDAQLSDIGAFASQPQQDAFMAYWMRRWADVVQGLDAEVESLDDERAYHPEVMDVRGAVAALPEAQRAEMGDAALPSFAQIWAVGFMYAVESWPEEWAAPRDKEVRKLLDEALQAVVALTEDDNEAPTLNVFADDGPPSVSVARFNAFADAVWAVYDLRALWRSMGPRVETVRKEATPGRNDLCHCGSGKKFKKCHGA
jgi:uncharacterized protein